MAVYINLIINNKKIFYLQLMNHITYKVSDWSICHDFMDKYIQYRNVSIYKDGELVLNTYNDYDNLITIFNIEELCKKTDIDIPYVSIIFIVIMIGLFIFCFKCSGNCPNDTLS